MSSKSGLFSLLSEEEEPSHNVYNGAIEIVVNDPYILERLTDDHVKDTFLLHLTTRGYRLARFFNGLHHYVRASPRSSTTFKLAAATANLLTSVLAEIDQLLKPLKVLEFLVPSLEVCFAPHQPPVYRKLSLVLGRCGSLLEHLTADRLGSRIVRQWAYLSNTLALDPVAQEVWTQRLVDMVSSCPGYHNVTPSIQHWPVLMALKGNLEVLEMRLLEEEDNGASLARPQETRTHLFPLDDDLKEKLKTFDLALPESRRMVQSHLHILKSNKIPMILRSIATSFPCKLCIPALGSLPRSTNAENHDQSTTVLSKLDIDILGKAVGVWKILLSGPALKSVQSLSQLGRFSPVRNKLIDLASGCCKSSLAGASDRTQRLKVPLAKTRCGQDLFILWQVDVGTAGDMELLQQVLIVWEVGDTDEISKAIDRIVHLQGYYTDEKIHRCRQRPSIFNGKQIPVRFDQNTLRAARLEKPSVELDIRTTDQDTIDMANKFYALTEPVMRSILDNDLAAEFPFDLSMEEARVITHFQTASLILGRSGTGKTTCLVFKLVGKFLASKAVIDERPARQVLLTRSSFLADKLRTYTRRLIETLSSNSLRTESIQLHEHLLSMTQDEESDSSSVLTLRDQSFPLVCTFEDFLNILETTVIELDRQDYENFSEHRLQDSTSTKRLHQHHSVDFYAFKVDYWPRFSQSLTKDLSVNLVFAEIMGVIKGSIFSRVSLAPISREEYLTRSCRMAPSFTSEAERQYVYNIFELYENLKLERGEVDYVDRVVKVLRVVRRDQSLRQLLRSTFDEIYIDEIQDQRSIDIELFLSFLKDGRGFHFAGDTAQAISQDSTFRFSDIKRLFHDHFAEASISTKQNDLAVPQMFTLSKNYRSHQGILGLASLVMGMIWKGFPETVDKLDPEIGNLSGPKPVLFLGCDVDILQARNVATNKFSERAADFGAEQVILVRDTRSKTNLKNQVGDVALILTILESKGMEFEDVILWNFFSECPDQSGVRVLNALKNDEDGFDPRKHGAMCSELKHLYVAITRARNQLSIVEGSEIAATPVVRLLTEGSPGPLVEVTRPNDNNFVYRVDALRPNTSVDPAAWFQRADDLMRRRMFEPAIMAFNRAGDVQGETRAQGFLKEEEGRKCHARKDIEGFTRDMRVAIEYFLKGNLVGDAVRVLIDLGDFGEAAKKWFDCRQYSKAAPLFADAGLHTKAAECHHRLQHHSEAADSLRQAGDYDEMVSYVDKYSQKIPSDTLRSYSLLCKLLLKQNKVASQHRNHAIRLLGSQDAQEACFLEYGMDDQLAELYADQMRHGDLYGIYSRTGQLEKALELVMSKDLLQSGAGIAESAIIKLLDYVVVGRMMEKRQQDFAALRLRTDRLMPNVIRRIEVWEASYQINSDGGFIGHEGLADKNDEVIGRILTLRKTFDATAVSKIRKLDDVPFEKMQDSVRIVQDLALKNDEHALAKIFVLTGVWTLGGHKERYVLLPWSPLHGSITNLSATDVANAAKKWALDKIASTVLALDSRVKVLWNSKWRVHCLNHLTTGTCRLHKCQKLHESLSHDDCSRILQDLLRVNSFFCSLAVIYYHHVMTTAFQKNYLGIRRHWLERLLRELIFLSSTEQSTSAIMKRRTELLHSNESLAVRSSLEGLLYFRVRTEWKDRSDFTALLEQMQVAETFGPTVRSRLFRALSQNLHSDDRRSTQRHLGLLNMLTLAPDGQSAAVFKTNLETFLRDLEHHKARSFRSLHAFTTVCESLATYLTLKICGAACVMTQSWTDLYRPTITMAVSSLEPLEWDDRYRYQQCLIELVKGFCRVLRRMNESPTRITLLCSRKPHEAFPLQKRNAELVAILLANVAAITSVPRQLWLDAQGVFPPDSIRELQRLKPVTSASAPGLMIQKLAPQLLKQDSKDALVVVVKDRTKEPYFSNLEGLPGVTTVPFDQLRPPTPNPADATTVSADPPVPTPVGTAQGDYTQAEKDAVAKIKQLWRRCYPKIRRRRSYISLPVYRAVTRFFNMSAQCPATTTPRDRRAIRKVLVVHAVSLRLRLGAARESLSRLQEDAMDCAQNVEISTELFESVDDILGRTRKVDTLLGRAEEHMSEQSLEGSVREGVVPALLEEFLKIVEGGVGEVEQSMLVTRKLIAKLS